MVVKARARAKRMRKGKERLAIWSNTERKVEPRLGGGGGLSLGLSLGGYGCRSCSDGSGSEGTR